MSDENQACCPQWSFWTINSNAFDAHSPARCYGRGCLLYNHTGRWSWRWKAWCIRLELLSFWLSISLMSSYVMAMASSIELNLLILRFKSTISVNVADGLNTFSTLPTVWVNFKLLWSKCRLNPYNFWVRYCCLMYNSIKANISALLPFIFRNRLNTSGNGTFSLIKFDTSDGELSSPLVIASPRLWTVWLMRDLRSSKLGRLTCSRSFPALIDIADRVVHNLQPKLLSLESEPGNLHSSHCNSVASNESTLTIFFLQFHL